jgi:hypothetical protein
MFNNILEDDQMNPKFKGGQSAALVLVNSLSLSVGQTTMKSHIAFPVRAMLEYWPYIKGCDEEPPEPEFIEIHSLTLLSPLYMTTFAGITLSLDSRINLLDILTDKQYDDVCEALLAPNTCLSFDGQSVTL